MTGAPQTCWFLVPDGFDDDERVSGGNVYDRRLGAALRARGLEVRTVVVGGRAPDLGAALAEIPTEAVVLVDGLLGVAAPDALRAQSGRLRVVVLAHMVASALPSTPDASVRERVALTAARRIITTSEWTRAELLARGFAEPGQVVVARPGTEAVPVAGAISEVRPPGVDPRGLHLLSVGAVAPHKGHDLLVEALAGLADRPEWTCSIVGSLDVDPAFAAGLAGAIRSAALADRIVLTGVRTGRRLDDAYRAADVVVVPSRAESFGMVVAEALARGIPVVAARVGGIPEAIGGNPAAVLVPPDDPTALRDLLRRWLEEPGWRAALAATAAEAARSRAPAPASTSTWAETARTVAAVLHQAGAERDAVDDGRVAAR